MAYYSQYDTRGDRAIYPSQQYVESTEAAYDPYDSTQPYRSYDQGGYGYQESGYGGYRDEPGPSGVSKEANARADDNATFGSSNTRVFEPK